MTHLIECFPPKSCSSVNSGFTLYTVNDILRQVGNKRENFALLSTDAAPCMSRASKTLKELHLFLMYVTCTAH